MSNTSDLNRTARDHANELGAQAKAAATQEAVAQADTAKQAAADKVQQAANAAGAAASQLDSSSPQAQAVQHVAERIEDVAMKLRHADVRELAGQATDMARRNPMLFIGGAAVAGFAAARFLKARGPEPMTQSIGDDPWAPRTSGADHTTVLAEINGGRTDV
jgi:hypothetical protein